MEQGQGSQSQGPAAHQAALNTLNTWQQQYAAQDTQNIPHDTVLDAFSQFASQAAPGELEQAASAALAQITPQQRTEIGSTILNVLQQNGLNPQTVGVQTTNPSHISAADLTNLTNYAQQQNPDLLRQLLSNPLVGMLLSALLSYAVQRFLGGAGGTTSAQPQAPGGLGGGLGGIITTILGGAQQTAPGQGGLGDAITTLLGGGQPATPAPGQTTPGAGGLDTIINQFLGGQQAAPATPATPAPGQTTPGAGGLDTLINEFLGGGQQAAPGTPAAPGGAGGLGTLLNDFLGSGQSSTANRDLGTAPGPANPMYETQQSAPPDTNAGSSAADNPIDIARDPGSSHN